MKQIVRKGIKDIAVEEVPDPVVSPHHVLVRPVFSLISSGTETASIHKEGVLREVAQNPSHIGKILASLKANGPAATVREVLAKFKEYAAIGYSGAGILVEKHRTVTDLEIGQRVAYGGEGTGHGETILTGRNLVARVPGEVSFEDACFATLGSIAMNAVRIAQIGLGDRVAVIGLGLVGQLVAQLARLQGAVVIATDLKQDRLDLAAKLGAHHPIDGGSGLLYEVAAVTDGKGADCVIVAAAAKSAEPCRQALAICRDRGRIVVVGAVEMNFPWNDMYLKEIQLLMSRAYGPGSYDPAYEKQGHDYPFSYIRWTENRNMEEFLRLIGKGQVQVQPLVTHRFALDDGPKAYDTIMDPASRSLAVLLCYEAGTTAAFWPKRVVDIDRKPLGKDRLGVALAGPGNLARWAHLPNLKKYPHASLRAIHSASGVRGKSVGARFGAARCTTDYEEILQDPEIDVVIIVSRNQHHASQALSALRAGKHVFVEKPMALDEDECRALYEAVNETGKQLTVGFNRRFAPLYVPLKERLARRCSPAVINCRVNSPGISGSYWMADPAIGGAILGEACHFVDLMYWMLDSEPVSVSAYSLPTGKKEPVGENNMAASFRFADGSIGNLTYCTVGSKTSGGERVEVFTEGLGVTSENFKKLSIHRGISRTRRPMFADKGYREQLHGFLDGIRRNQPPAVTVRDGVRATLGCLRMLESARDGMPREIGLDALLS
jgi:predicted dehydrogenase/threonine dehydrogenase-like Zn-dependent dehydrogenase